MSTKTTTTVAYEVMWGSEEMKNRRKNTFYDLATAQDFFTRKQPSFAVDVFEVTTTVTTKMRKLT